MAWPRRAKLCFKLCLRAAIPAKPNSTPNVGGCTTRNKLVGCTYTVVGATVAASSAKQADVSRPYTQSVDMWTTSAVGDDTLSALSRDTGWCKTVVLG